MGSKSRIVLYAPDEQAARRAAKRAFARMDEIEAALSDYRPDSEIMRVCAAARNASPEHPLAVEISETLAEALRSSIAWSRRTGGAFDVTVGPLTAMWRDVRERRALPDEAALAVARRSVGYENLKLRNHEAPFHGQVITTDHGEARLIFRAPNMRLDFGGIGKGYAADRAIAMLRGDGIDSALVEIGGDMRLGQPPPGKPGWRIELRTHNPEHAERGVRLADVGVATSGDVQRFFEIDRRRYSHILDPKTGLGLTPRRAVSIIAPAAPSADAIASAVSVLGPVRGLEFIESQNGVEGRIVEQRANGLRTITRSSGFSANTNSR